MSGSPEIPSCVRPAIANALEWLKSNGAAYADSRYFHHESETLSVRNGEVKEPLSESGAGVNIRVLANGAWGFAASAGCSEEEVIRTARAALDQALGAAGINPRKVALPSRAPSRGTYASRVEQDPFSIPLEHKLSLLTRASRSMMKGAVRSAEAAIGQVRYLKLYMDSEGSDVLQRFTYVGAGLAATAVENGQMQRRTLPLEVSWGQGGYEIVQRARLDEEAERVASEALELLSAPNCPAGEHTLILGSGQMALQIHESCGHPTELDRALGWEVSLAGSSFLSIDRLNRFTYGSPIVNLYASSQLDGGLGTFGWDDEGTPSNEIDLVREGQFTGYLSSRETAALTGAPLHGSMRAQRWHHPPIIRMTNVSLRPGGAGSLDDLVAGTAGGILMDTNRTWSIDDLRLNFQFGCEVAWEIKNGRKGRMFRNALYTGRTPEFWGGCDAICSREEFRVHGVPHCGKGDPMQIMLVGHGCVPARYRKVNTGARV
ncbi:MAG: Metalloprotease TldD [Myxococcota bacterium]|nr:Metalloprotease TldD [Myxococcota bacterium]